ncbi:MAG: hypothetical protein WCL14_06970 [Bacteroidota bacterium]
MTEEQAQLKARYEKLGREDRELNDKMTETCKKIPQLADDGRSVLDKFHLNFDAEKEMSELNDLGITTSGYSREEIYDLYADYFSMTKDIVEFIKNSKALREEIYNFVDVINETHDDMASKPRTETYVHAMLKGLEKAHDELKVKYQDFEDTFNDYRTKINDFMIKLG